MNQGDFVNFKNFSLEEFRKVYRAYSVTDMEFELNKVNIRLYHTLQLVRDKINAPININNITNGGHVSGSYHYKGEALDFHCGDSRIHPNIILQACLTAGFKGVGWYPEWNNPGFHVDIGDRPSVKVWKKIGDVYKPLIEA